MEDLANFYHLICPHCDGSIIVHHNELNCRIFRHGVFIDSMQPINPHASKEECDQLVASNRIKGCGKPFRVEGDGENITVVVCDYI